MAVLWSVFSSPWSQSWFTQVHRVSILGIIRLVVEMGGVDWSWVEIGGFSASGSPLNMQSNSVLWSRSDRQTLGLADRNVGVTRAFPTPN